MNIHKPFWLSNDVCLFAILAIIRWYGCRLAEKVQWVIGSGISLFALNGFVLGGLKCFVVMLWCLVVHVPDASLRDLEPRRLLFLHVLINQQSSHPLPSYNQYISCTHLKPYKPLHHCTNDIHRELIQEMYQYTGLHSWKDRPPDPPNDL